MIDVDDIRKADAIDQGRQSRETVDPIDPVHGDVPHDDILDLGPVREVTPMAQPGGVARRARRARVGCRGRRGVESWRKRGLAARALHVWEGLRYVGV